MGLMDILNGMENGPRGARQPAPAGGGSGGMSPWMMALLGLLAYKAVKGGGLGNILGGGAQSPNAPVPGPRGGYSGGSAGGLGDILGGMLGGNRAAPSGGGLGGLLGGLLGGAAAGSVLNGGLRNLVQDMQDNGHGETVRSWVGRGDNQSISPNELGNALGAEG